MSRYNLNDLSKNTFIEHLQERFKGRESFTRKELHDFYCEFEPALKETTFRWRIFDLKRNWIIRSLATGIFTLGHLPEYYPELSDDNRELTHKLSERFSGLDLCIWSTKILNEFMLHLPGNSITILEVEKEALEPVFHYLQDLKTQNIFLQPNERELERYVNEKENAIIIKQLVTKSPIRIVDKVPTITLEKLIVDIYSDKKIFEAYQGSEFVHIINNIYKKYSFDITTLFNYAKRRTKEKELKEFLLLKTDLPKTILND